MYKIKLLIAFTAFMLSMFAVQAQTPGGVTNASYTWQAWLTPDSYDYGTGVWTNKITGAGTVGNFSAIVNRPVKLSSGYNFHPSIEFTKSSNSDASKRMATAGSVAIASGQNVTSIFVYKRANSTMYDFLFSFNDGNTSGDLAFYTDNSDALRLYWPTGTNLGTVLTAYEGIIAVDNANNTTNQVFGYVNGVRGTGLSITSTPASINSRWTIGAFGTTSGSYGYEGVIQEIIILRASGTNNHIEAVDLQKIHSYLAIKYGVTLNNTDNYVNSDGYAVWNRTTNSGYNNNIFGIGRDNAAGLNQVQSRNQDNDMLTVYKGTLGTNNNNNSSALTDKTFLMLGSNGLIGNTDYVYPAGTAFNNGSITDRINYRSTAVYKAQVTTAGVSGGSQTVNINVISSSARYVFVSTSATFLPVASTRIYPISAKTAANVVINDGEYVTTAGYQATPGGVKSVTFAAWLTPESYSNGVWTNLIGGAIGDFTQPTSWGTKTAPNKYTSGTNFYPAVQFRPSGLATAANRLQSQNGSNLATSDAFTFLIVYKAFNAGFTYQNLLNFAEAGTAGGTYNGSNYALSYPNTYTSNTVNVLAMGWPTTARSLGAVPFGTTAMVTVDNNNGQVTANGIRHYLNGTQIAQATSASGSVNNRIVLGSSAYQITTDGERGINADIQEVIMLQRPKVTYPFLADINSGNDLKKIHSYLAIKYGIGMPASDYMATDGTVVWNNAANAGYNQFIFGVGRDDETGLYQKQSVSVSNNQTVLFLGPSLMTLNDLNAATLVDKQYLVLGSNGSTSLLPVDIADGEVYDNGSINATTGLNYQSGIIYKAQLTNLSAMTVHLKLRMDYLYVFVSKDPNFTPSLTRIYEVNSNKEATVEIDTEYKYIRYAGYSAGPGGVNDRLRLWLRADDEGSLDIQNLPLGDVKLTSYPYPVTNGEAPAVQEWKDQMRGHTYSWVSNADGDSHRIPVYEPDNLMMNYHPSVRFWGSGATYGSYLSNPNGILTTTRPANNEHTAYYVTSSDFSQGNDWIYPLTFGAVRNGVSYDGPMYGMQKVGTTNPTLVGRFRVGGWEGAGTANLFNIGATSISGYYQKEISPNVTNINFRFNGREDIASDNSTTVPWTTFNMSAPSMLGSGWSYSRTVIGVISEAIIFEKALSANEQERLESYLAIKYGTTLRPSNTATYRFNYKLSNGVTFWYGDVLPSAPVLGKYATFYNNIAAVIRDDAARLHNVQSHSTDAGSLLHMGVAGKKLGSQFEIGELPNDLEAVVWGSNAEEGVTVVTREPCADFETIFNKKWMVHKLTHDDRTIAMLVGAQNNSGNNLGSAVSAGVMAMYTALGSGNDVSMIVADSPEKLTWGNPAYGDFIAVVPMKHIDGEQQCIYTFSDSIVYVTFGYKPNLKGCDGEVVFDDKTYGWDQWTRQNYNITGIGGAFTIDKTTSPVDLGDGVTVGTKIVYDNGVRANSFYPRFTTNPRNGLEIQRRSGGSPNTTRVTTTITFSTPVVPSFQILGLDTRSRQMDKVIITASCPGGVAVPKLSPASNDPNFKIVGNTATVYRTRSASSTDRNGTLNVSFEKGVTTLTIEYLLDNWVSSEVQSIFISPITLTSVLPPPTINEDGLSFTKKATVRDVTVCDPVEYTFTIGNTTGEAKYLNFTDILPDKMTWKAESVSFDTINAENPKIAFNTYGRTNTLTIDSLLLPCSSEITFVATAILDADAPTDEYANQGTITYERIRNSAREQTSLNSEDARTRDPFTVINATWTERKDTVTLVTTANPAKYKASNIITVTLQVSNPNLEDITDMFTDISWDAGFKYVTGSWNDAAGSAVVTDASDSTMIAIAGASDGLSGFILSNGGTVFTFQLKAPDNANLEYETDELGHPTPKALSVFYEFTTEMDDPCIKESLTELSGIMQVPFSGTKSHIIVNKHVTVKTAK